MTSQQKALRHASHGGNARPYPTLPSISHLISGKALDLSIDEAQNAGHYSDEEEEDIDLQKRPGSTRRRSSRGRITDRAPKLEEKLKLQDEEFEKDKSASREELRKLQMSLESEKAKCSLLEEMLDKERADRLKVEKEVEVLKTTSEWSRSRAGTETSS